MAITRGRIGNLALAALGTAALISASACTPATVAHLGSSSGSSGTSAPSAMAPWALHVATPHAVSAPAFTAYPWAQDTTGGSDPYGLTMRQCVSYAAWYINAHGTSFGYNTKGPNGTAVFGDATTWDAAARKVGFIVSTTPRVGAIAQWHSNEHTTWSIPGGSETFTAGSFGHVAVVTKVLPNGNVNLVQYNLGGSRSFSAVTNYRAPRYIYIPLSSPYVP